MGIADLQPHNYVGREATSLPFLKIFSVLHEQHARDAAVLVAALALLTDELVRRAPPKQEAVTALQQLMLSELDVFQTGRRAKDIKHE